MSRVRYVSDLKLCLEILSRFEIYPDLAQLEQFLADETYLALLNDYAVQIKTAWKKHTAQDLPDFTSLEGLPENPPESKVMKIPPFQQSLIRFKLPNATVGKPYQGQLEWSGTTQITILSITGLGGLGLSYDLATNNLSGEPEKAGEHRLSICYQQQDSLMPAPQTAELSLVINSDPKSLWKNIPSDTAVSFWKADSDSQGKTGLYDWKLAAASKRGRSHAHVGSCRDDDFALHVDHESHWQIAAVADGAGSSEFSREGARIVAHHSVEVLSSELLQANTVLDDLISHWQLDKNADTEAALHQALVERFRVALNSSIERLATLAKQQQVAYRDFYSTLLVAAHKSFPKGEFVVGYWIGDGGLGIYNSGQGIELLGVSDSGEYAGQTRFLDNNALESEDLSKRLHISSEKNFTALLLMTDGITDPLFETDDNLRNLPVWDNFWQQIQSLLGETPDLSAQNLLTWLDFWSPGNHDDRTIALIYR